jgi:hypothetical protein
MNMIVEKITDVFGGLPAWLGQTPTGRKLLSERDEAVKKLDAEYVEERKRTVAEYQAALTTEAADTELQRMKDERKSFVDETAPRKDRATGYRFREGSAVNRVIEMDRRIAARQRTHRAPIEELRKKLKDGAPAWLKAAVSEFTADLALLEKQVGAMTGRLGEKLGYDHNGNERVIKVLDYAEYREAMIGKPGARGWLANASKQARAMLLEAVITPSEAKARLDAIRKKQPAQKASWRNV